MPFFTKASDEPASTTGGTTRPISILSSQHDASIKPADDSFSISLRGKLVFFTLAVLTLMAALDGTSLSVALPVSYLSHSCVKKPKLTSSDHLQRFEWNGHRGFLEWNFFLTVFYW